jgi:hypothetical protein
MWGGWGPPWGMFFMPIFFLIAIVCLFFIFRRGFPFCGCHSHNPSPTNNNELLEEVRKLRQEVEEFRKESKK